MAIISTLTRVLHALVAITLVLFLVCIPDPGDDEIGWNSNSTSSPWLPNSSALPDSGSTESKSKKIDRTARPVTMKDEIARYVIRSILRLAYFLLFIFEEGEAKVIKVVEVQDHCINGKGKKKWGQIPDHGNGGAWRNSDSWDAPPTQTQSYIEDVTDKPEEEPALRFVQDRADSPDPSWSDETPTVRFIRVLDPARLEDPSESLTTTSSLNHACSFTWVDGQLCVRVQEHVAGGQVNIYGV